MSLELHRIQFGEIDAKHEVFAQAREGSYLLLNAFQMPPSVNFDRLYSGSKFFISGPKGSGKTSLMLYLKHQIEKSGGTCHAVLFKSKLTELERQRIIDLTDFSAFTQQENLEYQYDYSLNWLWFIISEITRLIDPADVVEGRDELEDLRALTGVSEKPRQSIISGIQLTKVKAIAETALNAGPFKSSIKAEIDAISTAKEKRFVEIVDICERALTSIRIRSGKKICLFFDELELFVNKPDQKERDLHLIKDLLYTVSRINQAFGAENPEICVYASVRSEVLYELNRASPELQRDVDDFGVPISWVGKSSSDNHAILKIVEAKINQSEIEEGDIATDDIWGVYFSEDLHGKPARRYLLDISMFKPRTLVSILSNVARHFPEATKITHVEMKETEPQFSNEMWREIEEELRTSYTPEQVSAIKSVLSGSRKSFKLEDFRARISSMSSTHPEIRRTLGTMSQQEQILRTLYRVGAIGTFFIPKKGSGKRRDAWVFREHHEPQLHDNFIFHASLSKALQLV